MTAGSTYAGLQGFHADSYSDFVLFKPDVTELAQWFAAMQLYYAISGMWYGDRAGMRDGVSGNWEHDGKMECREAGSTVMKL